MMRWGLIPFWNKKAKPRMLLDRLNFFFAILVYIVTLLTNMSTEYNVSKFTLIVRNPLMPSYNKLISMLRPSTVLQYIKNTHPADILCDLSFSGAITGAFTGSVITTSSAIARKEPVREVVREGLEGAIGGGILGGVSGGLVAIPLAIPKTTGFFAAATSLATAAQVSLSSSKPQK